MHTPNQPQPVPYAEVQGVFNSVGMACVMLEDSPLPHAAQWTATLEALANGALDKLDEWDEDPDNLPAEILADPAKMFALSAMFTADELAGAAGAPMAALAGAIEASHRQPRRSKDVLRHAYAQFAAVLTPLISQLRSIEIPEAKDWLVQVETIARDVSDAQKKLGKSVLNEAVQPPAYTVLDIEALTKLRGDTTMSDALDTFRDAAATAFQPQKDQD